MRLLDNGKLTTTFDAECLATRDILSRVGDKWSVLVLAGLGEGSLRFAELRRALVGISHRVLTSTLRGLERDGLVSRTVTPQNPPRVDYALTDLGRSALVPVVALATWAQGHRARVYDARAAYDAAVEARAAEPAAER